MLIVIKDIKDTTIIFNDNKIDSIDLKNYEPIFIKEYGFGIIPINKIEDIKKLGYNDHNGTGIIMPENMINDLNFKHPYIEGKFIKKNITDFREREKLGLESITFKATEGLRYSYGVEIETSDGVIPVYILKEMSVNSVRDGSLKDENGVVWGSEIVTDILKGDSGLRHLQKITFEMSKRCTINKLAGVHVHFGQGDMQPIFSKEHILNLYQLCYYIQNEISLTLPHSRRNNEYCRFLDNLNLKLPNINKEYTKDEYNQIITEQYDIIVKYLAKSDGFDPKDHRKKYDHPKGFKCGYDHSVPRYCWVNFIPTVFNTRKNSIYTCEFRNHGASLNFKKIKKWIMLCMAVVHFADNFKRLINPGITIDIILENVYPRQYKELINYFNERKYKFSCDNNSELTEYNVEPENRMKLKEIICI